MKFHKTIKFFIIILFALVSLPDAIAHGNGDFMRETGKINVVTAVLLLIFFGLAAYLFRLDRKLTKLEHQITDDHEWKN